MDCCCRARAGWTSSEGDLERRARARAVPAERWQRSEDHHYAVWGLRWAACFFARHGDLAEARACADALSSIATTTGHADALAALAHALGETALADGEADAAAEQLTRAAELHEQLEIPFERAQSSSAPASRSPPRASARPGRAVRRGAHHRAAAWVPRRWPRETADEVAQARRVGRSSVWASAPRPTTTTPASRAASSR